MTIIDSDNVVMFDVDETLVLWENVYKYPMELWLKIEQPSLIMHVMPHLKHIELLKQFKARGHKVIVWSQGGYEWALRIVKALGLENVVDVVMSKPKWYVDDLNSEAFLGKPVYLQIRPEDYVSNT